MATLRRGAHEPRGLAVDEQWWPRYWAEFGDDTFLMYDVDIDRGRPSQRLDQRLIVVLVIGMPDDALQERAQWLGEQGAFYCWVKPSEFTKLRALAQNPECTYVHYSN
jgi:hypothetical protein